jgi:hypothetical protein
MTAAANAKQDASSSLASRPRPQETGGVAARLTQVRSATIKMLVDECSRCGGEPLSRGLEEQLADELEALARILRSRS